MVSVRIPLTQNKFARVSIKDAERVMAHKWHAVRRKRTYYAATRIGRKHLSMHRFILQEESRNVDHKNHDGLHNYRSNLRTATQQQNAWNSQPNLESTTGYKGVSRHKNRTKQWRADIVINGKNRYLGYFVTAKEAAIAYNEAASSEYGTFASLNKIEQSEGEVPQPYEKKNAKLSDSDVALVRSMYKKGGMSQRKLGAMFGVSQATISMCVNGITWKEATGDER